MKSHNSQCEVLVLFLLHKLFNRYKSLFERHIVWTFLGLLIDEPSYCTFCTTTVKGCKVGFFAELILIQIKCVKSVDQSLITEFTINRRRKQTKWYDADRWTDSETTYATKQATWKVAILWFSKNVKTQKRICKNIEMSSFSCHSISFYCIPYWSRLC